MKFPQETWIETFLDGVTDQITDMSISRGRFTQKGRIGSLRRGIDGRVGPRTGTSERIVLVHYAHTRRVTFGVGNAWSFVPT